jgi:hypothetical protein
MIVNKKKLTPLREAVRDSKKKQDWEIVTEIFHNLRNRKRPLKTKRTLVLTKSLYEKFDRICRAEKCYPSEVIDEFISLFVARKLKGK